VLFYCWSSLTFCWLYCLLSAPLYQRLSFDSSSINFIDSDTQRYCFRIDRFICWEFHACCEKLYNFKLSRFTVRISAYVYVAKNCTISRFYISVLFSFVANIVLYSKFAVQDSALLPVSNTSELIDAWLLTLGLHKLKSLNVMNTIFVLSKILYETVLMLHGMPHFANWVVCNISKICFLCVLQFTIQISNKQFMTKFVGQNNLTICSCENFNGNCAVLIELCYGALLPCYSSVSSG